MASERNYWSPDELLGDIRYWSTRGAWTHGAREKVKASWDFLRMSWGCPPGYDLDDFVMDEVEGRGHKFVRKDRNIARRYG